MFRFELFCSGFDRVRRLARKWSIIHLFICIDWTILELTMQADVDGRPMRADSDAFKWKFGRCCCWIWSSCVAFNCSKCMDSRFFYFIQYRFRNWSYCALLYGSQFNCFFYNINFVRSEAELNACYNAKTSIEHMTTRWNIRNKLARVHNLENHSPIIFSSIQSIISSFFFFLACQWRNCQMSDRTELIHNQITVLSNVWLEYTK